MRKLLSVLGCFACCLSLTAQEKMNCCSASATETFSQFASDKSFAMSHQNPLPYTYSDENGKPIVYKAADGTDAYGWEIKAKKHSNNYILVIHEWWGLNDYIKKETEQIWKDLGNVNVIALDLYDKKVASTREDAAKYMQQVNNDRAIAIIKGAIDYAGKNAKIYTIGWCFGGGWSLQASILAGAQAAGCVMYYGMPEKNIDILKGLHADVLGIFGNRDQWINPKVVDEFAANMKTANKTLIIKRYDADHAFANPSNPSFNKEAKEDAYKNAIAFLKMRIK